MDRLGEGVMNEQVADFLIKLAEDSAAREAFRAAPDSMLDSAGLSADERSAILCGDDAEVFALYAPNASPAVAKIWTGVDETPGETPAVAKIWTGVDETPGETPAVAKIWTGVDEALDARALRQCA